jgi:hypothetical protein
MNKNSTVLDRPVILSQKKKNVPVRRFQNPCATPQLSLDRCHRKVLAEPGTK